MNPIRQHHQHHHWGRGGYARLAAVWLLAWGAVGGLFLLRAAPGLAPDSAGTPQVVAATASKTPAHRTKNIEDVKAGDRVLACDPQTGEWGVREVVRPLVHDYDGDVVTVQAGREAIEATGNHPFWVASGKGLNDRPAAADVPEAERHAVAAAAQQGRWVEARHLQPGDVLVAGNGRMATVEELSARREKLKVYNLEVADLHTYAVGTQGLVVHNKTAGEPLGGGPQTPPQVYRSGGKNPGSLTPRPQDQGMLSTRDSISNPWPKPDTGPVIREGQPIQVIATSKLPPGTVVPDGAPFGPQPSGHVSIGPNVPPDVVKNAIVDTIKPPK